LQFKKVVKKVPPRKWHSRKDLKQVKEQCMQTSWEKLQQRWEDLASSGKIATALDLTLWRPGFPGAEHLATGHIMMICSMCVLTSGSRVTP
jgi:hypothetical protein